MNSTLKLKIVALMATLMGTLFCNSSDAVQNSRGLFGHLRGGIVTPVEPALDQKTAEIPGVNHDRSNSQPAPDLPPIVSATQKNAISDFESSRPRNSENAAPASNFPPIVSRQQAESTSHANMLTPIAVSKPEKISKSTGEAKSSNADTPSESGQLSVAGKPSVASTPRTGLKIPATARRTIANSTASFDRQVAQATAAPTESETDTNVQQATQLQEQRRLPKIVQGNYSSAGVLLYPNKPTGEGMPPIVSSEKFNSQINTSRSNAPAPPIVQAPSQIGRNLTSMPPIVKSPLQPPMIVQSPMISQPETSDVVIETPRMMAGQNMLPNAIASPVISDASAVIGPRTQPSSPALPAYDMSYTEMSYSNPEMSYSNPEISDYVESYVEAPVESYMQPADQTYFDAVPQEAPAVVDSYGGECSSCAGTGCASCSGGAVSECTSCGPGGCFDPNFVTDMYGCCGSVSSARRYLHVDAIYMDRDDGKIINSNFGGLTNFDEDLGWRFTLGERADATRGREMSYLGTTPLTQNVTRTDALGRMRALFGTSSLFASAETSPFFNSVLQTERKETELHTIEFNRVRWGWDVVKTFWGIRYFYIGDEYSMFSQNIAGETGSLQMDIQNHLIGPHFGKELFYDVGYRVSFSGFLKGGVYFNLSQADTRISKLGTNFVDAEDNNTTVAGSVEGGLLAHYQLNRRARLRFGYNALWLGNVSSISDNVPTFVSPFTGTNISDSDDMFFHGAVAGLEIFR